MELKFGQHLWNFMRPRFASPPDKGAFLGAEAALVECNRRATLETFQELGGKQRLGILTSLGTAIFFQRPWPRALAQLFDEPVIVGGLLLNGLAIVIEIGQSRVNVGEREVREVGQNLIGRHAGLRRTAMSHTRMRVPEMHGLPPHTPGVLVTYCLGCAVGAVLMSNSVAVVRPPWQ